MTSARKPLQAGPALTLYAILDEDGVCCAEVWLAGLPTRVGGQFQTSFERLTQIGYLMGEERMHPLKCPGTPGVQEIKVHVSPGYRLYVIREGRDWVATHGRKKPKDKRVCEEAKKARTAFASYQERSQRR